MICSRLNSRATQSASKTAECQRFRVCVYVVSPEQGHLATPFSPTPTIWTWFPRASLCPARIDGPTVCAIRSKALIVKLRCGWNCMIKWQGSLRTVQWLANTVGGVCGCQCRYSHLAYGIKQCMFLYDRRVYSAFWQLSPLDTSGYTSVTSTFLLVEVLARAATNDYFHYWLLEAKNVLSISYVWKGLKIVNKACYNFQSKINFLSNQL